MALGTERARAKNACKRVGGRIKSLTTKIREASRTTGTTATARTFAGLPRVQHPTWVQRPRKERPISKRFAHARTREVVTFFIGLFALD
jgi:hypothetical protein